MSWIAYHHRQRRSCPGCRYQPGLVEEADEASSTATAFPTARRRSGQSMWLAFPFLFFNFTGLVTEYLRCCSSYMAV